MQKLINFFMQQRGLLIFISIVFALSSIYLSYISDQALRTDSGKKWWAVYFEDVKTNRPDFAIKNYSKNTEFSWEVFWDKEKIAGDNVEIRIGETKNIKVNEIFSGNGKITITVFNGSDKKEIYKYIKL